MATTIKHKIIYLLVFLSSCISIPLSKSYTKLNPYAENTVLVFKSNKKTINDTLFVTKIGKSYRDGPVPVIKNHQLLTVYTNASAFYNNGLPLENKKILTIEMKGRIDFSIAINENATFFSQYKNTDVLTTATPDTLTVGNRLYTDVVTIYSTSPYLLYRDNEISKVYWSLSNGYIRLVNPNGETYDLIEKYIYLDHTH
jgi:hypothetical protein